MAKLKLSPTRSNLTMMRERLKLAREGHQLLNKKRDVLIIEILRLIEDAERIQRRVDEQFVRAYQVMQEARAMMGTERVRRLALSRTREVDVEITPRSIMGVVVPSVRYTVPDQKLIYGFGDTSVLLDQVRQQWAIILSQMGQLSEKVTTVWRLATELRRTQRRVNALEHIFIPSYEETVDYIRDMLEEKDREDLFRLKRAKDKLERISTSDPHS